MKNLLKVAVACVIATIPAIAGAQPKNNPAATLQRYLDAVNSASYEGILDVVSDDLAPFTYAACTPQMTAKVCFATFVNETIIKRHGSLVSPSAKVSGDVIAAVIEVRHDGTRAAGISRMLGVDTITVKNNKIVSFKFEQLPDDPQNKKLAAYNAAHAPPPAAGK